MTQDSNRLPIIATIVVALSAVSVTIWVGMSLRGLRTEFEAAHQSSAERAREVVGRLDDLGAQFGSLGQSEPATIDALPGLEIKKASDIVDRFNQLSPKATLSEVAPVLAEVDQWIYASDEEEAAKRKLGKITDRFRELIEDAIERRLRGAVTSKNGTEATAALEEVNELLSIYPAPMTDGQRTRLREVTESILDSSRRVGEIRRLRYNTWATSQIEKALGSYHEHTRWRDAKDDVFVQSCVDALKDIDPASLDPVVMDLYSYALNLTIAKIGESSRITLAKKLTDPSIERKSPSNF